MCGGLASGGPAMQACSTHPRAETTRRRTPALYSRVFPFGNGMKTTQKTYDTRESGLKFISPSANS